MTPRNGWWALLVVLALGFWAGGAAAQSNDSRADGGGWFDDAEPRDRPLLKLHGKGPQNGAYDPPPPDFRSDPSPPSSDPETVTELDEEDAAELEDGESQQRAAREFSPHLAPYGRWVEDPFYGRVWVPSRTVVGVDFRPYVSGGHWELTADDQWIWVSDYPFGWVTFHYGRWAWLSGGVGWGWVPGYVWAPAWVDFRIGSTGYVGWGPAPPYGVWRGGLFVSLGVRRPVPYIFCPTPYVFSRSLPRYVVRDRHRVRSIAHETRRYRPRHVAGSVRVRSPSPREAHIPRRYLPSRRVVAEPRGSYVSPAYRAPGVERRQRAVRPAPRDLRYRAAPSTSRSYDVRARPRSGVERRMNLAPSQRLPRATRVPGGAGYRQRSVESPRGSSADGRRRSPAPAVRGTPPPRASGSTRYRSSAPAVRGTPPPRASSSTRHRSSGRGSSASPARRGADSRRSAGPARGGSSNQHRSRRDGR